MIKNGFFKKVLATVLSSGLFLGSGSASASFPPFGRDWFFSLFPLPNTNTNTNTNDGQILHLEPMDLITEYKESIDQPLYALLSRFSRNYALNFPEDGENYRLFILADNIQVIDIAEELRSLIYACSDFTSTILPLLFSAGSIHVATSGIHTAINEINAQILAINEILDNIPPCKPTREDLAQGKCIDSHIMDF